MTIAVPTASSIKLRFPEFSDVDDYVIEFAIEEARLGGGTNWTKGYTLALIYLAAHYVASSIAASTSGGEGDLGAIASESIGRFSISYAKGAFDGATHDDTSSTSYGRRYAELAGANFHGPVIV